MADAEIPFPKVEFFLRGCLRLSLLRNVVHLLLVIQGVLFQTIGNMTAGAGNLGGGGSLKREAMVPDEDHNRYDEKEDERASRAIPDLPEEIASLRRALFPPFLDLHPMTYLAGRNLHTGITALAVP